MTLIKNTSNASWSWHWDLEVYGVVKPLNRWARETGIARETLLKRAKSGWGDDRILRPTRTMRACKSCTPVQCDSQILRRPTLCWQCQNATGGCNWSRRLEPVEGWDAIQTDRVEGSSYLILACPAFIADGRGEKEYAQ